MAAVILRRKALATIVLQELLSDKMSHRLKKRRKQAKSFFTAMYQLFSSFIFSTTSCLRNYHSHFDVLGWTGAWAVKFDWLFSVY